MKIEIRQDIREYILSEVNTVLARLGVSEVVYETKVNEGRLKDKLQYEFETAPIRQSPMIFKKLYLSGYMVAVEIKEEDSRFYHLTDENDIVVVNLGYYWESFRGGSNGTELGRMIYAVSKVLPEDFRKDDGLDRLSYYVRKLEGLKL